MTDKKPPSGGFFRFKTWTLRTTSEKFTILFITIHIVDIIRKVINCTFSCQHNRRILLQLLLILFSYVDKIMYNIKYIR